jgi:hypothetical protein
MAYKKCRAAAFLLDSVPMIDLSAYEINHNSSALLRLTGDPVG